MKKIVMILLVILLLVGASLIILKGSLIKGEKFSSTQNNGTIDTVNTKKSETQSQKIHKNISSLRKNYALTGLIKEGDTYLENKQLIQALRAFLTIEKKEPQNLEIQEKIGDTYFEMKKYGSAYNHYSKLSHVDTLSKEKIFLSYLYQADLNSRSGTGILEIYKQIDTFKATQDDNFFWKTSISCLDDIKKCQNKFEEYINSGKGKNNTNIQYINSALERYKSMGLSEQYFKDTQFVSALFQAKLYPITHHLGKNILKEKKSYLPILKIIAQGLFERGNIKEAKKYLKIYNKIDSTDPKVNYMLGSINIKLHEYVLSNIYFNKAKKYGYTPLSSVSKRLIYNYYLVEDFENMLSEFGKLLLYKTEVTADDYSLAIYYALINNKDKQATVWLQKALELYPEVSDFYGYKGWIYKEKKDYKSAEDALIKGFKINKKNPLINLNLGILTGYKGNYLKAKIYLRNTIRQDTNGMFGKEAGEQLERIIALQKEENEKIEKQIQNYTQ